MQAALRGVDKIYSTVSAFAAVGEDGTVVTWGCPSYGCDFRSVQAALRGVEKVYSTDGAFAAVVKDEAVVTWGHSSFGGDSKSVHAVFERC